MRLLLLCKRRYTNRDLINDKFGRLYHFPRCWVDAGHEVAIHAIDYRSLKGEIRDLDGIEAHSHPLQTLPLLDRIVARVLKQRGQRPDVVMASGDSHLGYLGLRLARRLGVPFVFDVYDHYPDFAGNRLPGMGWMFHNAMRGAQLVTTVSKPLASQLIEHGLQRPPWIATQGTDTSIFRPLEQVACRDRLGLDRDTKYIAFTGNLDTRIDIDGLTQAVRQLRQSSLNAKVLFAGTNLTGAELDSRLFHPLGQLPQTEIPYVIGACNVAVLPYADTPLAQTCNPCKLSEYIACGVPLVTADVSDIADELTHPQNALYPAGSADQLYDALRFQLEHPTPQPMETAVSWCTVASRLGSEIQTLIESDHSHEQHHG